MKTCFTSVSAATIRISRNRVFRGLPVIFALLMSVVFCTALTPGDECKSGLAAFEKKDYETAVKHFTDGAVEGDQAARLMLGLCYNEGYGVKKDEEKSLKLFRESAKSEDGIALLFLGIATMDDEDNAEGTEYLKKSADKGCTVAQFQVASLYLEKEDEAKALEYFKKAAAQSMTDAKTLVDYIPGINEAFKNQDLKIKLKSENATNYAIVYSQIMVGSAYKGGLFGVKKDEAKAEEWYAKARKNGWDDGKKSTSSKNDGMGGADEYEKGVDAFKKKDYATAVEHFNKSVDAGNGEAMLMLSYCLSNGFGVKKDEAKSDKLTEAASKSGNRNALAVFGAAKCGEEGKKEEGMALLKESAGKGCAYAQFMLGTFYSMDDDGEHAVEYLSMAATQLMTEEEVIFDLIPEMTDALKKQALNLKLTSSNITNISIVNSQIMLGSAYGKGLWGIEQDKEIAKEWFKIAGRNGWVDADKAIKALEE